VDGPLWRFRRFEPQRRKGRKGKKKKKPFALLRLGGSKNGTAKAQRTQRKEEKETLRALASWRFKKWNREGAKAAKGRRKSKKTFALMASWRFKKWNRKGEEKLGVYFGEGSKR